MTERDLIVLGAAGRTGKALVAEAHRRGYRVIAHARRPIELAPGVIPLIGEINSDSVAHRIADFKAPVVSALGPGHRQTGWSITDGLWLLLPLLKCEKVVWVLGAAIPSPDDDRGRFHTLVSRRLERSGDTRFAAKQREYDLLRTATIPWVAPRPPHLTKGAAGPYTVNPPLRMGSTVSRATLAAFMLDAVDSDEWDGHAPIVAGGRAVRPQPAAPDRSLAS